LLPRTTQRHPHGVENMDDLYPLNEASILSNVEHRFRLDYIYTRTGPILVAMNPFKVGGEGEGCWIRPWLSGPKRKPPPGLENAGAEDNHYPATRH
jgi:hypothetical protein